MWGLMAELRGLLAVEASRGWLITVEAHGHPGYPPSTQPDAVVNCLVQYEPFNSKNGLQ